MKKIIKGITYSFNRNIGTVDRKIRTIVGFLALYGIYHFYPDNLAGSILCGVFAIAQFGTVLSARCILCYFSGQCTIPTSEKNQLDQKGINYEK